MIKAQTLIVVSAGAPRGEGKKNEASRKKGNEQHQRQISVKNKKIIYCKTYDTRVEKYFKRKTIDTKFCCKIT